MRKFGEWHFDCDHQATRAAYAATELGGTASCDCIGCRNFVAARAKIFPQHFIAFLETLGIDPTKDGEVYHNARIAPGRHDYAGWFHFVGDLHVTGDFPVVDFGGCLSAWMCHASAPPLTALAGKPLVQLEFHSEAAPWVLDETEAD